jgi:hypothetical protein
MITSVVVGAELDVMKEMRAEQSGRQAQRQLAMHVLAT